MKRNYVVISENYDFVISKTEYFIIGMYNSYKEAEQCIKDCIEYCKEQEYPYDETYYIDVEIRLTKKIRIVRRIFSGKYEREDK